MRPSFRIFAYAALACLVVLVAGAIALLTMDARVLIGPLEERIEGMTGREIVIEGPVSVALSFVPTLVLEDVSVANAPWGSAKEMVRTRRLEVEVALLPLLRKQLDVRRFTLVEPMILLETDANGKGNWMSPAAKEGAPADPVSAAASAFALGEFGVDKGEVRWRDGATGRTTLVRIDSLTLQSPDADAPVSIAFVGAVDKLPLVIDGRFGSIAQWQSNAEPWPVTLDVEAGNRKVAFEGKLRQTPEGIEVDALRYASGETRLRGSLVYVQRAPRPLVRFDLSADTLAPADLMPAGAFAHAAAENKVPPAVGNDAGPAGVATGPGPRPEAESVALGVLHALDAQGSIAVNKLLLGRDRTLSMVRAKLTLDDGKLDITELVATGLGGSGEARITLNARSRKNPTMALHLDARGLDVASVIAWMGNTGDVRGGKADVVMDINARGATSREWSASVSGLTTANLTAVRWHPGTQGAPAALETLAVLIDRKRKPGTATEITCAAARLPWSNGVARFDRGMAVEMPQVALAASGTIDLRESSLDLVLHPRVTDRTAVDLSRLAGAVRVSGPLDSPRVRVDAAGSVAAIAQLGAMAGNRGAARVAGALGPGSAGGGNECADALQGASKPPAAAAGQPAPTQKVEPRREIERALGKLLGR